MTIPCYSLTISTRVILLELAEFCSRDTLELCGDILQPGGHLETPGLALWTVTTNIRVFTSLLPTLRWKVQ